MTEPLLKRPESLPAPLRRFTVEEYHRLGETGILGEDDRVELLEGWIVEKMIHDPRHGAILALVGKTLGAQTPAGWHIRSQLPVATADSEPEPDVALVRGTEVEYIEAHPRGSDVGLVVEVSDTSLNRDRDFKARVYARESIPIYWIINLVDGQVEVYSDPVGDRYDTRADCPRGQSIPLILDGREVATIDVSDLLGF